jgi:6-phosphogluconate dehydrogenase
MRFGIIGLGRIGGGLARQALAKGHEVVGYNRTASKARELSGEGLEPVSSLEELVSKLQAPRTVFIYVTHGDVTESVCQGLLPLVERGDVVIDGGNSHWSDSQRRHALFADNDVHFLDVGTSGGLEGARNGACFMVGGAPAAFEQVAPLLRNLAVDGGVVHAGPAGAGHFTKLVHNAIEFGMVQSIAEGVELLERSEFELELPALFRAWNHGSVIRGWLLELMGRALAMNSFDDLSAYVEDTGEVKWVVNWATEQDIPTPVITLAQQALLQDRDERSVTAKAVALLRHEFGGHPVHRAGE